MANSLTYLILILFCTSLSAQELNIYPDRIFYGIQPTTVSKRIFQSEHTLHVQEQNAQDVLVLFFGNNFRYGLSNKNEINLNYRWGLDGYGSEPGFFHEIQLGFRHSFISSTKFNWTAELGANIRFEGDFSPIINTAAGGEIIEKLSWYSSIALRVNKLESFRPYLNLGLLYQPYRFLGISAEYLKGYPMMVNEFQSIDYDNVGLGVILWPGRNISLDAHYYAKFGSTNEYGRHDYLFTGGLSWRI